MEVEKVVLTSGAFKGYMDSGGRPQDLLDGHFFHRKFGLRFLVSDQPILRALYADVLGLLCPLLSSDEDRELFDDGRSKIRSGDTIPPATLNRLDVAVNLARKYSPTSSGGSWKFIPEDVIPLIPMVFLAGFFEGGLINSGAVGGLLAIIDHQRNPGGWEALAKSRAEQVAEVIRKSINHRVSVTEVKDEV